MESKDYSNFSLKELYELYNNLDKDKNQTEAKLIFEQILVKEKSEKNDLSNNNLASLSDRFAAAVVDFLVLGLPVLVVLFLIFGFKGLIEIVLKYGIIYSIIMLIIGQSLYLILNGRLLYKYGQTIGKKFLEIKIVDEQNKVPDFMKSYVLRYLITSLFPLLPFIGGFVSMADILFIFKKDRRCIHDLIAGTKVIKATEQ